MGRQDEEKERYCGADQGPDWGPGSESGLKVRFMEQVMGEEEEVFGDISGRQIWGGDLLETREQPTNSLFQPAAIKQMQYK